MALSQKCIDAPKSFMYENSGAYLDTVELVTFFVLPAAILLLPIEYHAISMSSMEVIMSAVVLAMILGSFLFRCLIQRNIKQGRHVWMAAPDSQVISGIVVSGPYKFIRHPWYALDLFLSLLLSVWLVEKIGPVMIIIFLFALLAVVYSIRVEEKFLLNNFPEYTKYKTQVEFRIIPWLV